MTRDGDGHVRLEKRARSGVVTLCRPDARNALSNAMRAAIAGQMAVWEKDPDVYIVVLQSSLDGVFCAGGDIKEMAWISARDHLEAVEELAKEYRLYWQLDRYPCPVVSLIDGVCMGSGVGLMRYNTHRVAGENFTLAMPEAGIGFLPDAGATWFLSQLTNHVGTYLALTGRSIGPDDALAAGLVTHCIPQDRYGEICDGLADAEPVDPLLDERHERFGGGELDGLQQTIAAVFSGPTIEDIIGRLELIEGRHKHWAEAVRVTLLEKSPVSLRVALEQMRRGRNLTLRQSLELEHRLAGHLLARPDFAEGVRALMIDKDNRPQWTPGRLEDVSIEEVLTWFDAIGQDRLGLPPDPVVPTVSS